MLFKYRCPTVTWTRMPLTGTSSSIKIFRTLQILTTMFNNNCRTVLLPLFNMFHVALQVVSFFVCIRFHSELSIVLTTAFIICILVSCSYVWITCRKLGRISENSSMFLRRADNGTASKQWRQVVKSLPVLTISVGGCYNLQKQTVLTFFLLVCTATSNLLVSTS